MMVCTWKLLFDGFCGFCTLPIKKGQLVRKDKESMRFGCKKCDKLLDKGREPIVRISPAQAAIDQIKLMQEAKASQIQIDEQLEILRQTFPADRLAQRFFAELRGLSSSSPIITMALKHDGRCQGCAAKVGKGAMALWDKQAHRIWCLDCVPSNWS